MYSDCDWTKMIPEKYTVLEPLGKGGFGNVYKIKDEHIDKFYALKIQKNNAFYDTQKEIEMLKCLECEGLPALHDVFYDEEYSYIVMELARGINLETYVKENGKLSAEETLRIGCLICDILKYLHTRPVPVIHGDIKPENIMITDDKVSLVDLGCALLQYSGNFQYTGTPEYAAPELLRGEISTESDVYSFGRVLFYMLTGRRIGMLQSENVQAYLRAYAVPRRLCKLVERCLREDIKLRFQSGLELSKGLHGIKTKNRIFGGKWVSGLAFLFRWSGAFFIIYSLLLYRNQMTPECWFLIGAVFVTVSFIIGEWVDKCYKNTILECECNILVSDGL